MRRILRQHWPIVALLVLGILVYALPVLAAVLAQATQDIPVVALNNPNSPGLVGWSVVATIIIGAILKALSPGNTTLPIDLSPTALHTINVVGAVATSGFLAIEKGTPWPQAIAAGVLPLVAGFVQVGAAKGTWKMIAMGAGNVSAATKAKACRIFGLLPPPEPPPAPEGPSS